MTTTRAQAEYSPLCCNARAWNAGRPDGVPLTGTVREILDRIASGEVFLVHDKYRRGYFEGERNAGGWSIKFRTRETTAQLEAYRLVRYEPLEQPSKTATHRAVLCDAEAVDA